MPALLPSLTLLQTAILIAGLFMFILLMYAMRPRRFYFVRHGETLLNAQHIRQGRDGALSEKGRMQAEAVGQYLKRFHISRILTSTYPRAEETAAIINTHVNVPIIPTPLLEERKNPSEIIGKSTKDPNVIRIVDQMDLAFHEDEFRYSDEENFLDLRARARKCLQFLARERATEIAVVTHHVFLKMLLAYLLYRDRLHSADFTKLAFFNYSDNAGITVCEFHPWKLLNATHGWEVITYNEQPELPQDPQ